MEAARVNRKAAPHVVNSSVSAARVNVIHSGNNSSRRMDSAMDQALP